MNSLYIKHSIYEYMVSQKTLFENFDYEISSKRAEKGFLCFNFNVGPRGKLFSDVTPSFSNRHQK